MERDYKDDPGLINVWLNLCKILIGLVVVYQVVLSNQLGLDNLITGYDVLVPEEQIKELNPENPFIRLNFLPISMVRNYDSCELEVTRISAMPPEGGEIEEIFSEGSTLNEAAFKQRVPFMRNPSMLNGDSSDNRPQNLSQVSFNLLNFFDFK